MNGAPTFAAVMQARSDLHRLLASATGSLVPVQTLTAIAAAAQRLEAAAAALREEEKRRQDGCSICAPLAVAIRFHPHDRRGRRRKRDIPGLLPDEAAPILDTRTSANSRQWCHCPECGVVYDYEHDSDNFQQPPPTETLTELGRRAEGAAGAAAFWLEKRAAAPAQEAERWREHALGSLEQLRQAQRRVGPPS